VLEHSSGSRSPKMAKMVLLVKQYRENLKSIPKMVQVWIDQHPIFYRIASMTI